MCCIDLIVCFEFGCWFCDLFVTCGALLRIYFGLVSFLTLFGIVVFWVFGVCDDLFCLLVDCFTICLCGWEFALIVQFLRFYLICAIIRVCAWV